MSLEDARQPAIEDIGPELGAMVTDGKQLSQRFRGCRRMHDSGQSERLGQRVVT